MDTIFFAGNFYKGTVNSGVTRGVVFITGYLL